MPRKHLTNVLNHCISWGWGWVPFQRLNSRVLTASRRLLFCYFSLFLFIMSNFVLCFTYSVSRWYLPVLRYWSDSNIVDSRSWSSYVSWFNRLDKYRLNRFDKYRYFFHICNGIIVTWVHDIRVWPAAESKKHSLSRRFWLSPFYL